ncbi:MAG: 50S ribosomal protein L21 [Candidatus Omnitrophica bacterium]|nr:50S ribosomal protein L21 [Candidatus Omnitrophota bacterium]
MYAVVEIQGSQYRVEKDEIIQVNRMEVKADKPFKADKVLFGKKGNSYFIGEPYVENAYVECDVIGDKRGKKVVSFKYRDRKSSQSIRGHRQDLTEIRIKDIHFAEKAAKKEKSSEKES